MALEWEWWPNVEKWPKLTNFGKFAGMSFQVIETSKLEFVGIVASRLMHVFKFEPNRSTFRYLANSLKKGVKWSTSGQKKVSILLSSNSKHRFRTKFGPKTLLETGSPMRLCTAKGSFGPLKKYYFTVKWHLMACKQLFDSLNGVRGLWMTS